MTMSARTHLTPLLALAWIAVILLAGCTAPAGTTPPAQTPAGTPQSTPPPSPTRPPAGPGSFDQTNDGGTYPIATGAVIQLRLPENPTTGYIWNLSVTTGLTLVNETYIPDDPTGRLIGSGGTHVWFLKAVITGDQTITGVNRRPWEPASPGISFYTLNLVVGEGSCGGNVCTIPVTSPSVPVPARYPVYTEADSGKAVQEALGGTFGVRLPENPTTGYSWNLSVPVGLTLSRDEYLPSSSGVQMVGGGGVRSFTFIAAKAGAWNLTAEYRRPWMKAGTVTYQDLEGGFYGIVGDDGQKYDPLNLEAKFRKDGLRVAFDATVARDVVTTHMWGTPVNITDIEEIPAYSLRVQVS
jgi:inhibitor of cysteine peptidase